MKRKRVFIAITIIALIMTIILISLEAYYVAIALVAGALILGYRELWSLIKRRKLPPVDERVRENITKAIRNGFILLITALAFLMLPFSVRLTETPATVHVLGGLFVSGGMVYLLSYLFYDRVAPRLGARGLRLLKIFLLVTGVSLATGIISIFLHNAIYGLFIYWFGADFWGRNGTGDEAVFFILALLSALAFAAGIAGSLVIFIKGLFSRSRQQE